MAMEVRDLTQPSGDWNVYDIKTKALTVESVVPRHELHVVIVADQALIEKTPEQLLKEQKHRERKNWGTLGALVRNRIISWEHVNPLTGEINYSSLGQETQTKYTDLIDFLKQKEYKFDDKNLLS